MKIKPILSDDLKRRVAIALTRAILNKIIPQLRKQYHDTHNAI